MLRITCFVLNSGQTSLLIRWQIRNPRLKGLRWRRNPWKLQVTICERENLVTAQSDPLVLQEPEWWLRTSQGWHHSTEPEQS